MCLSSMRCATGGGIDVDELLAGQDAPDVLVVEHLLGAGQAKRGARDDHGLGQGGAVPVTARGAGGAEELPAPRSRARREDGRVAVEQVGDQVAELARNGLRPWCARTG